MYSTACVSRKVTYVSLNRGHSTAQTRTHTTLTEQLLQCCWPTSALDRTDKGTILLLNCAKNKQQHSCQGHCRPCFLWKLGWLSRYGDHTTHPLLWRQICLLSQSPRLNPALTQSPVQRGPGSF